MFTGLIQGQGKITALNRSGAEARLTIAPQFELANIIDGESIAVNGACLSVEHHSKNFFAAYASAETLSRTTLGKLCVGDMVNLERALAVGDRLGGHLVSGHVDTIATVESVRQKGQSLLCRLRFDKTFAPQVIAKGSVTLDGISLTINDCGNDFLEVNIIPDTQKRTTMRAWKQGVAVNMETDLIGKYVCNVLGAMRGTPASVAQPSITRAMLLENGFL